LITNFSFKMSITFVCSDFLSATNISMQIVFLKTKKAVFEKPYMVPNQDNPEAVAESEIWCDFYKDYIAPSENCNEPMGSLLYPIFDKVDKIERTGSSLNPSEDVLKAQLIVEFYWRTKFRDLLPERLKGIILVVDNACGASFTYQINGPLALYLGRGDRHDPKYNYMVVESTLSNLESYFQEDSKYSGAPIEKDTCVYSFHVYPSDEMKYSKSSEALCLGFYVLHRQLTNGLNPCSTSLLYKQRDSVCDICCSIHNLAILDVSRI
jgi:hypothetical protein